MRVFWTDADFLKISEAPLTRATLTLRLNGAGRGTVTAPTVPDSARGIVALTDGGEEIWRGYIRGVDGSDAEDDMTAWVLDLKGVLGGFLAWPSIDGNFAAAEYDTYTGAASSAIYHYMLNVTDASAPAWRRLNITLDTDTSIGNTVKTSARFDYLLTLLSNIATLGGVRFRFIGSLFTVDTGTVHSSKLYAKHAGTATVKWHKRAPQASVITAGGTGEGTARVISTVFSPADMLAWGVIEQFYDLRNVSTTADLEDLSRLHLAAGESGYAATVTPTESIDTSILPGDTVRVWADGAERQMVVQTVTYNHDDSWQFQAAERAGISQPSWDMLGIDSLKRSVELLTTK